MPIQTRKTPVSKENATDYFSYTHGYELSLEDYDFTEDELKDDNVLLRIHEAVTINGKGIDWNSTVLTLKDEDDHEFDFTLDEIKGKRPELLKKVILEDLLEKIVSEMQEKGRSAELEFILSTGSEKRYEELGIDFEREIIEKLEGDYPKKFFEEVKNVRETLNELKDVTDPYELAKVFGEKFGEAQYEFLTKYDAQEILYDHLVQRFSGEKVDDKKLDLAFELGYAEKEENGESVNEKIK